MEIFTFVYVRNVLMFNFSIVDVNVHIICT